MVSSADYIGEMMQGFARISSAGAKIVSLIALVFTLLLACRLISGRQQEQRGQRKDIIHTYSTEALTLTAAGCLAGIAWDFSLLL